MAKPQKAAKSDNRILVVEDSPTQAMEIKLLLEEQQYRVFVATNGREGFKAARAHQPSLIISDIIMPEMDGYELCRALKTDKKLQTIPVILLTTLSDREDIFKGLNVGADYYVTKPFNEQFLLSKVESLLMDPGSELPDQDTEEMEVVFAGKRHRITSNYRRILNLLFSTYENAVFQNRELRQTKDDLEKLNDKLREKLEELVVSEERFRSLVLTIPDIVYRIDSDGNFTFINEAICRLGFEPGELVGTHFSEIILPADVASVSRGKVLPQYMGQKTGTKNAPKMIDERRTGDRKTTGLQVRLINKFKELKFGVIESLGKEFVEAEVNSAGMYGISSDGMVKTFIGTVGVIRDISDRKQMEDALRESEERSRTILNFAEAGIIVIDPQTYEIVEANPAALKMIGAQREDVVGQQCYQYICPAQKGKCPLRKDGSLLESSERTLRKADGTQIPILKTVAQIVLSGREHLLESFVDISQLKKAEEKLRQAYDELEIKVDERTRELKQSQAQLIQAEKVAALGTLTAGIAHELNNPMMGMLNFIQYCLKKTPEKGKLFEVLTDAEHETKRCIAIVNNLLTFSRIEKEGEEKYQKIKLASIFDRILRLLTYRIEKENVSIVKQIAENTPEIWIKPSNIQQVFLNLAGNALDALKESQKKEIRLDVRPRGEFVRVTIADSGPGIGPEIFSKIFDPFFTTKPPGKGTGLGLSVSQSIVNAHGGKIVCTSKSGAGTKIEVRLPTERNLGIED